MEHPVHVRLYWTSLMGSIPLMRLFNCARKCCTYIIISEAGYTLSDDIDSLMYIVMVINIDFVSPFSTNLSIWLRRV